MAECTVQYKGRGKQKVQGKNQQPPKAMRTEAAIVRIEDNHIVHVCKFDWNNLSERWAFIHRLSDVLEQGGFAVAMKRIDPGAERLAQRFHVRSTLS